MQRDFKGVWIPKLIWENKDLSWGEKLLFIEIDSLAKNGECFASNSHFSDFLDISTRQIQNYLASLQNKGYVKIQLFYKGKTKIVEKRIIIPIHKFTDEENFIRTGEENFAHMDEENFAHMDEQNFARTGEENFVGNNTQDNNTINNTINNTKKKTKQKKSVPNSEYEQEFETLWAIYPKKVNRGVALTSYIKARKDKKYTYETIKIGLQRYIEYLELKGETDSKYILNGSTFFNQLRFLDEYNVVGLKKKPKSALEAYNMLYGGEQNERSRSGEVIDYYPNNVQESFQGF